MSQSRNDVLHSVDGVRSGRTGLVLRLDAMNSSVDTYVRGARQESILAIAPSLAGAGVKVPGRVFHPRCPFADDRCKVNRPVPISIGGGTRACHAIEEGRLPVKERTCVANS